MRRIHAPTLEEMGRVQYPRRAMYEVESLLNASLEPDNSRADVNAME